MLSPVATPLVSHVDAISIDDPPFLDTAHSVQEGKSDFTTAGTSVGEMMGTTKSPTKEPKEGGKLGLTAGLTKGTKEGPVTGAVKGANDGRLNGTKLGATVGAPERTKKDIERMNAVQTRGERKSKPCPQ